MPRKITIEACAALLAKRPYKSGNTEVRLEPLAPLPTSVWTMLLHGNEIAKHYGDGSLDITNAGWESNTTKERLNGLPGVSVNQRKGVWYLNGDQWDGDWTEIVFSKPVVKQRDTEQWEVVYPPSWARDSVWFDELDAAAAFVKIETANLAA